MEYGIVFPTSEIGNDPAAITDFVQTAEGLGYTELIVYDHVLGAEHANRQPPLEGPYDEDVAFHEPMTLLAYLAAVTDKIGLSTGVLILPQRQTALVAKQAAQLAILSNNRFRMAVGSGWNYVEYESLGVPYAGRGKRLDDQVELMRALWTEDVVDYHSDYHRVDRAGLKPLPDRPIPIWFGGFSMPAIKRAATVGDGFLFGTTGKHMQKLCEAYAGMRDEAGRTAEAGIEVITGYGGGPEQWLADIETWQALGADRFTVRTLSAGAEMFNEIPPRFVSPKQHIDALESFMKAVS